MSSDNTISGSIDAPDDSRWSAVFSLAFSVVGFIAAELFPISMLSPIASDLGVSEGLAGQAVSATSVTAMIFSLLMASATRRLDRRTVMLGFTLLFIASNIVVGLASNFPMLLAGRVLLGMGLGGFWSMSSAVTLRLVPSSQVPRALSILFGGVSASMVIAAPFGTFMGDMIGWRGVFLATAALGTSALLWQYIVLPKMPPSGDPRLMTLVRLLNRPAIVFGVIGMMLVFGGHFTFYTYLRPFLEQVTQVNASTISFLLFGFGVANLLGTSIASGVIRRSLLWTLGAAPLLMSVLAMSLVWFGDTLAAVVVLISVWGFAFGAVPVAWTTWVTRAVPDETESAGGLQVASIQLAISIGAAIGGLLMDKTGPDGAFVGSAVILVAGAVLILTRMRANARALT
ncbi:MFS transporter [Pseudomonas putida]|uniref:MFS transporter n=1 Tax=Pseudomonas putida TaxID=303 RepID=UPI00117A231D|nr:MFS transporter [Pseudomonas putida]TRO38269.1 MFS transporter [Pseudomonas putida]